MRKIIGICILLVVMLTVSGCGKEVLTCTKTDNWDPAPTYTQKVTFRNEKMDYVTQKVEITSEESLDDEFAAFKEKEEEYKSKKGITFEADQKDNTILVSLEIDPNEASAKDLDEFGLPKETLKLTIDKLKEKMEDEGYTCK